MDALIANAISMGILAWIWANVSAAIGAATWAGFMGTTTYYASGQRFIKGWVRGIIANMVGVLWAIVCVEVSKVLHLPNIVAIMTGVISFGIVAQAKWKTLSFIPGVYIGCSTTFGMLAMNNSYMTTAAALLMGSVVGILSDAGGELIVKLTTRKKEEDIEDRAQEQA
ncbi:DUF1097 domain-containing protein [Clostridium aciditolerans]|uniref:DUF1097 domain-containing protein n=1 Tax=Clostridium aciditolerans TaxID=339861 RepID=A0A934HVA2_9CLOT|nr:DUF1097 domain-containing protein [Clostridium aciditolerans]MBI6874955.1 DUF1097 domain-containing protein [Clostridium aciditolerans]